MVAALVVVVVVVVVVVLLLLLLLVRVMVARLWWQRKEGPHNYEGRPQDRDRNRSVGVLRTPRPPIARQLPMSVLPPVSIRHKSILSVGWVRGGFGKRCTRRLDTCVVP